MQAVFQRFHDNVMVRATAISNVVADTGFPNTGNMLKYILDGIEECTGNRNTDFQWGNEANIVSANSNINSRSNNNERNPVQQNRPIDRPVNTNRTESNNNSVNRNRPNNNMNTTNPENRNNSQRSSATFSGLNSFRRDPVNRNRTANNPPNNSNPNRRDNSSTPASSSERNPQSRTNNNAAAQSRTNNNPVTQSRTNNNPATQSRTNNNAVNQNRPQPMNNLRELVDRSRFANDYNRRNPVQSTRSIERSSGNGPPASIPILPNREKGVLPHSSPRPIVIMQNSCTFDSFCEVCFALYKDNREVARIIDQNKNRSIEEFILDALTSTSITETVDKRAKLWRRIYSPSWSNIGQNVKLIDLFMTPQRLFGIITKYSNIVYSAKEYSVCHRCNARNEEKVHIYLPLNNGIDQAYFASNLQTCIDQINWTANYRICERCQRQITLDIKYNAFVLVDMSVGFFNEYPKPLVRKTIQKNIMLGGRQYELRAAIQDQRGHVLPHILRNNGQWIGYDGAHYDDPIETPDEFASNFFIYGKFS